MKSRFALWVFKMRAPVIDPVSFRREIKDHRARILIISKQMWVKFKDDFPHLSSLVNRNAEKLLNLYLALHDLPKLMNKEQLKSYGWNNKITLFEALRVRYGQSLRPSIVENLNQIEFNLKNKVLDKQLAKFTKSRRENLRRELETIELIADTLDTKVNRGLELGFTPQIKDAGRFLCAQGLMREAQIADQLEPFVRTLSIRMTPERLKSIAN